MRIGLGCASAWGQPWFSEKDAFGIVHRALDLGVRIFDTGPSYSGGHAEPRLGRALCGRNLDVLEVSTKVGTHNGNLGRLFHDLSPEAIFRSVDSSRRNLKIDRIPLLYLHGPGAHEFSPQLLDTLEVLRVRGWVAHFGVNSYHPEVIQLAARFPIFTTFMVDYNVLRIDREPVIQNLRKAGFKVVCGSALANHLFAPRFLIPKKLQDIWYLLRMIRNSRKDWALARQLRELQHIPGWTPAQLALAFVLENPAVDVAMFGTTRVTHLEENLATLGRQLPPNVTQTLRETAARVRQITAR